MPRRAKVPVDVAGVAPEGVQPEETSTPEKPVKGSSKEVKFSVYNAKGAFVRSYTTEVHGKEAESLASQYAAKIEGTVKEE